MNSLKRLAALILAAALLTCAVPAALADELDGHEFEAELRDALARGVISGYEDGTIRPDDQIKKDEAAMVIMKNLTADKTLFTGEDWYNKVMTAAVNWEVMENADYLSVTLNRKEAWLMLAKAALLSDEDTSCLEAFPDSEFINEDEAGYIAALVNRGLISGDSRGLGVYRKITRAQYIALFLKMLDGGYFEASAKELNYRGIKNITLSFEHEEVIPCGGPVRVTAVIEGSKKGSEVTAVWYIGGIEKARETFTMTGGTQRYTYDIPYEFGTWTPESEVIGLELYHEENGAEEVKGAHYTQAIDNDVVAMVARISNKYEGDFTLEYAENNDYTQGEKTTFVNYKGYSSTSKYLIWVNRHFQRTNIFEGSKGHWTLIKEFIVGTGRPGSVTPVGIFKVTGKQDGWYKLKYDVKPIVRFYAGGYAFHSRLLYHGTDEVKDPSIGFPVSLGCMRMYNEDIQWMYDNIPVGTTVVVW